MPVPVRDLRSDLRDMERRRDENEAEALASLRDDVLSVEARKQRRNVMLTSSVALLLLWLDLVPRELSALGVNLGADDRRSVRWALFAMLDLLPRFIPHSRRHGCRCMA